MFGYIIKTIILTIFAIIILHFTIEHTKNIWNIPNNRDYSTSYKKIIKLLDTLPDKDYLSKSIEPIESIKLTEDTNSINYMETQLTEYINNMT